MATSMSKRTTTRTANINIMDRKFNCPRIVIAGTHSGVGKTSIVVGLISCLQRAGLKVAAFKCGPDYLDSTYHKRVINFQHSKLAAKKKKQQDKAVGAINLDSWLMSEETLISNFILESNSADIAVIEGVMGLFDGYIPGNGKSSPGLSSSTRSTRTPSSTSSFPSPLGSTAHIAKILQAPVVLITDAAGTSSSLAAVIHGFNTFDPQLQLAGVIGNRVGSNAHWKMLETIFKNYFSRSSISLPPALLGGVEKCNNFFPSRHLGLVTAFERGVKQAAFNELTERISKSIDIKKIIEIAKKAPPIVCRSNNALSLDTAGAAGSSGSASPGSKGSGCRSCRIAVAYDKSFHFYYHYNLRSLEALGAQLVYFSPLKDKRLPPQIHGIILGGGYPEKFAAKLAGNITMKEDIRNFANAGGPIYAECGGLIYLSSGIRLNNGQQFSFLDLIPGLVQMNSKLVALGYASAKLISNSIIGKKGTIIKGHQFRYSSFTESLAVSPSISKLKKIFWLQTRKGKTKEGHAVKNVLGTYLHTHWGDSPHVPVALIKSCLHFKKRVTADKTKVAKKELHGQ